MNQFERVKKSALSLPEVSEEPHFEKTSFRVKKKIFLTYDTSSNRITLKLSEVDQSVFTSVDRAHIFPVPNLWGTQGWTFFTLDSIPDETIFDAVACAYHCVAPKKLAALVKR